MWLLGRTRGAPGNPGRAVTSEAVAASSWLCFGRVPGSSGAPAAIAAPSLPPPVSRAIGRPWGGPWEHRCISNGALSRRGRMDAGAGAGQFTQMVDGEVLALRQYNSSTMLQMGFWPVNSGGSVPIELFKNSVQLPYSLV